MEKTEAISDTTEVTKFLKEFSDQSPVLTEQESRASKIMSSTSAKEYSEWFDRNERITTYGDPFIFRNTVVKTGCVDGISDRKLRMFLCIESATGEDIQIVSKNTTVNPSEELIKRPFNRRRDYYLHIRTFTDTNKRPLIWEVGDKEVEKKRLLLWMFSDKYENR